VLSGRRESTPLRVDFDALEVDVRAGCRVEGLDAASRTVSAGGTDVPFDRLVIATGTEPIRLPGPGHQHVLRTDVDAVRLRDALVPGARIAVIGGSWIGAEVATAALARGCRVTCIEASVSPLGDVLGPEAAARLRPWWSDVDLRCGVPVGSVEDGAVAMADGEVVEADVVVTGVGVRPSTGWLAGSGLMLLPAVETDEALRTGIEGIVAVGDVAAWWSRRFSTRMDLGHWDDASAGASTAATSVLHGAESTAVHDPVPYFWSDQFDHKIEYVGHHGPADRFVARDGADDERGWTACWTAPDGLLTAAVAVDRSRDVLAARKLIRTGASPSDEQVRRTTLKELHELIGAR
jgi:NADPH-dependent 2,4-dienoyl-CoA reductase/sulfur reductase-like enzyme